MLRVLVADDDPGIVRTLMLGLKMMGCQPVGVESAEAAIKALEDKSADLLLTDMRMEGMSGVDLVRDAHARWPEMICVVMTAFASYENAVSAIKAGAYDYCRNRSPPNSWSTSSARWRCWWTSSGKTRACRPGPVTGSTG